MKQNVAAAVTLIVIWQLVVTVFGVPHYIVPGPLDVLTTLQERWSYVLLHSSWTFAEALIALAIAIVAAWTIAIAILLSPAVAAIVRPLLATAQSTPILALAPLLTAWFGVGIAAKVAAATLVIIPPLTLNVADGLARIRSAELDLFATMGATRWQTVVLLRVPRAMPSFFTALQIAIPLATLGAIVGEFVGAGRGIGFAIISASYYLRTAEMFTFVLTAALGSSVLVWLVRLVQERLIWIE